MSSGRRNNYNQTLLKRYQQVLLFLDGTLPICLVQGQKYGETKSTQDMVGTQVNQCKYTLDQALGFLDYCCCTMIQYVIEISGKYWLLALLIVLDILCYMHIPQSNVPSS